MHPKHSRQIPAHLPGIAVTLVWHHMSQLTLWWPC
jgi:hypothetical protein